MLAGLACFRATEPGAPGRGTDERVVQDFVAGFGRRPARALLRLFAEDATVSIEGLHIELRGAEEIRQFAEYGSAVGSRMSAFELSRRDAAVLARIREQNEWFSHCRNPLRSRMERLIQFESRLRPIAAGEA